jgi:hypothetical protein
MSNIKTFIVEHKNINEWKYDFGVELDENILAFPRYVIVTKEFIKYIDSLNITKEEKTKALSNYNIYEILEDGKKILY